MEQGERRRRSRFRGFLSSLVSKKPLESHDRKLVGSGDSLTSTKSRKELHLDVTGSGLANGCILFRNDKRADLLETVILDNNRFNTLPEGLCRCLRLRSLHAEDNDLLLIPDWIASLICLVELDLSKNNIQSVPEAIKCLKRLCYLNISFNPLANLDPSLVHCSNLSELYVNDCCLQHLPATIGRLHNLRVLEIRSNALQLLPLGISRLTRLEILDAGSNKLEQLPGSFTQLVNLKILLLDDNRLTQLPRSLNGIHSLEMLDVGCNSLCQLPNEIGQLNKLETLILNGNNIEQLPAEIGHLSNLKLLRVDNNRLKDLPPSFAKLRFLSEFSAVNNRFVELPGSICQLTGLEWLFLDGNGLQRLSLKFGDLKSLSVLSMRRNRLRSLPESFGKLSRLTVVDLRDNFLAHLPVSFQNLSALKALWLSHNQVLPKPALNFEGDGWTCYLLPQETPIDPIKLSKSSGKFGSRLDAQQSHHQRRIRFDVLESPSNESGSSTVRLGENRHAHHRMDAQEVQMTRTETCFGSFIRQAKVTQSKLSPRMLYQLDKMKSQEQRSKMFRSSALTIVQNDLECGRNDLKTNPLFRPVSVIRPYAMVDLKTLQAQLEAHESQSLLTRSAKADETFSHEYEAIFDSKRRNFIKEQHVMADGRVATTERVKETNFRRSNGGEFSTKRDVLNDSV